MNEEVVQAQFQVIAQQRNAAMDQVVTLAGKIAELEAENKALKAAQEEAE